MQHRLRLAGGAARERDQARVVLAQLDRGGGLAANSASSGTSTGPRHVRPVPPPARRGCARRRRSATDAPRRCAGAGLSRAAARCTAAPPRRCESTPHRHHPLRAVADQRHHHVAPLVRRALAARPPGARCDRPTSPNVHSRRDPSRASSTSARSSAAGDRARRARSSWLQALPARSRSRAATGVFGLPWLTHAVRVRAHRVESAARRTGILRKRRPWSAERMAVAADPYTEKTDEQQAITEMVRQFADEQILPQRRALRPRGRVPRADRRADEGARAVRGDDPRGVRRHGPGPDDLRDDRRGALARLDLDLGRRSTRTSSAPTC